jgi:hypothetical protein
MALTKEQGLLLKRAHASYTSKTDLSEADQQALNALKQELDSHIKAFSNGAFVKLSCRSPKDATVTAPEMVEMYRAALQARREQNLPIDNNRKLIELFTSHIRLLASHNADEALRWFIRSGRVCQDVDLALEQPEPFPIQIIIREWIDIPLWAEFRGFVYNKEFVALSQYFDGCYFEEVVAQKDEIQSKITEFFNTHLKPLVPLTNYIVDFAISSAGKVYVIELNPYNPNTDSCLFSWSRDVQLLKEGPFEFRYRTQLNRHLDVLEVWKPLLDESY